jgi:hypothetical protein
MQLIEGQRLGDYVIRTAIGAGGMGEVYRAFDTSLEREVAIKVLPREVADDPDRRARFEREAKSIAALNHENIVTIHAIGEDGGLRFLAMELVEGHTIEDRIPPTGMPTDELLGIALPVASALAAAHAKGIVHRDLKPGNVMVTGEGRVKVLDFGLAKLAHRDDEPLEPVGEDSATAAMTLQTRVGTVVGTMPYMSPEQLSGKTVGPASDIFSYGVMLYEMATGRRPFQGASGPTLISSILTDAPTPVAELSPDVPSTLCELIERCLRKDPSDRPADATALRAELEAHRSAVSVVGAPLDEPARSRSPWPRLAAGAIVLMVLSITAYWYAGNVGEKRWARTVALPEIQRLLDEGDRDGAHRMLRRVGEIIPGDVQLEQLEKGNTLPVAIETVPQGAEVFINSYADLGRPWISLGVTPIEALLPLDEFRFRVEKEGYETFEGTGINLVKRSVIELVPEGEAPDGMVRVPSGSASFGTGGGVALEPFWIDRYEVTNRRFKEFVDDDGYRKPEFWTEPVIEDGRALDWNEAAALFVDTTGRPGPAGWELGSYPEGAADLPVAGISWYEAQAFAAWSGTSLPTVFHWQRAAEMGLFADIITVSNFDGDGPAPVGSFGGLGPHGTYDMAGNVREWCLNAGGESRYSLGGAWSDPTYMYDNMEAIDPLDRSLKNGFRTMRVAGVLPPETTVAIDNPVFDFRDVEPVDDDVFEVVKGAFAYDRTDLDARLESVDESSPHWRRERVSFTAAYGGERVPAYLFLPTNAEPPYQTVVFFPSSAALDLDHSRNPGMFMVAFLIRSGRALMYPIYTGTYERQIPIRGYNDQRDVIIRASKDLQRSIDYLESRDDIESDRLAYCGLSLGASWGPIFTAVEDRLKASILIAGGLAVPTPGRPPETLGLNFSPRSTVPVLMVNGRNDFWSPLETEIRPMFDLQGASDEDKQLVLLDGGHIPDSPKDAVRPVLDWLDRYLGPL